MAHRGAGSVCCRTDLGEAPVHDAAMEPLCNECSQGPANIDGHAGLWVQALGAGQMVFRCRTCESLWYRAGGDGRFVWTLMGDATTTRSRGVSVPPRSGIRYGAASRL